MSDTYYSYSDVKVKIAHRLMAMDGWKVYGYHADESDFMTDYYSPAYWNGIAEKNGYILVIDNNWGKKEPEYYTRYTTAKVAADAETAAKIAKLERMTQDRGASAQEEATAREKIEALRNKSNETDGIAEEKTLVCPAHKANPPRCNWHIEKDGIILQKGTGLLKFAHVPDITFEREQESWQNFNNQTPEQWKAEYKNLVVRRWYCNLSDEEAAKSAENAYNDAIETYAMLSKFNELIARWNNIAGGMVGGCGESGYTYAPKKVTKYRKVWKYRKTECGSFAPGQCFRLVSNFNYGCYSGRIYRFVSSHDGAVVFGQRVSMKSGKSLTGTADASNRFGYYAADGTTDRFGHDKEKFLKWIEKGAIEWVEVYQAEEPYEVEIMVKVDADGNEIKPGAAKKAAEKPEEANRASAHEATTDYTITPDTDTRDGSALWVVKLPGRVSAEEFAKIREQMKAAGGYYSKFKKGFIFRFDPSDVLSRNKPEEAAQKEETAETAQADTETAEEAKTAAEGGEGQRQPEEAEEPAAPGYSGEPSQVLTADEIEALASSEQVKKMLADRYGVVFISLPYTEKTRLVYKQERYMRSAELIAGNDFKYCGFITDGKYYDATAEIIKKISIDIDNAIKLLIPDEESARRAAGQLGEFGAKRVDDCKNTDYTQSAERCFYGSELLELRLYDSSRLNYTSPDSIIHYIESPADAVIECAKCYIDDNALDIYLAYIRYNRVLKAYNAIINDKSNRAHLIKRIMSSVADQKTVRAVLLNGSTVRIEASAIRRLGSFTSISSWYVASVDRDKLDKDEHGRALDIKPEDIKAIYHGKAVLYAA